MSQYFLVPEDYAQNPSEYTWQEREQILDQAPKFDEQLSAHDVEELKLLREFYALAPCAPCDGYAGVNDLVERIQERIEVIQNDNFSNGDE